MLEGEAVGGRDREKGVRGVATAGISDHQAHLGPWICIGLAKEPRLKKAVARKRGAEEVSGVIRAPNVRSRSPYGPDSVGLRGAAGGADASQVRARSHWVGSVRDREFSRFGQAPIADRVAEKIKPCLVKTHGGVGGGGLFQGRCCSGG